MAPFGRKTGINRLFAGARQSTRPRSGYSRWQSELMWQKSEESQRKRGERRAFASVHVDSYDPLLLTTGQVTHMFEARY